MSKIGSVYKDYPEAVQELLKPTMEIAVSSGLTDNIRIEILEKMLCDIALKKFFGGSEMIWGEEEFSETINLAFAHTQIENLRDLNLIDSIENEEGEEVVWLTDEGKELIESIKHNVSDEKAIS